MRCRCKKPSHFFRIDETGKNGGSFIYIVGEEYEYQKTEETGFSFLTGPIPSQVYTVKNGKFSMDFSSEPRICGEGRTFFDFFEIIP